LNDKGEKITTRYKLELIVKENKRGRYKKKIKKMQFYFECFLIKMTCDIKRKVCVALISHLYFFFNLFSFFILQYYAYHKKKFHMHIAALNLKVDTILCRI
jgi:hypothetical protein